VALTLPPVALDEAALEHALDLLAEAWPRPVERARSALDVILEGVRRSPWTDVAWCASTLSPNGYPVQFVLDVGGDLGYVAEVAGPEAPAALKLGRALEVLDALGASPLPDSWIAAVADAQSHGELRAGTWIGVRHGMDADEHTAYVEVPRAAGPDLLEALAPTSIMRPLSALGRLDTVGISGTGRIELYCACESTDARVIESGMLRLGLGDGARDLIALVERTPVRPASLPLQGGTFGLAATVVEDRVDSFMVVVPARRVLGRDRDTRRRLLDLADAEGWDLSVYAELTQALERPSPRRVPIHGLLAWTLAVAGPPAIRIALAPPADGNTGEGKMRTDVAQLGGICLA
jgi:hypothetical protein